MAECLDPKNHKRPGTSDEFHNPYCDPCHDGKNRNVRVFRYCKDCVQFLCADCYEVHINLQGTKHHDLSEGKDMPRSQEEKPPRYEYCKEHPKQRKDMFCCAHKIMICVSCSSSSKHKRCFVDNIENVCKTVDLSDVDALYDNIKCVQDSLKSVSSSLDRNLEEIQEQKKAMFKEAIGIRDKLVFKVNKLYEDMNTQIKTDCDSEVSLLAEQKMAIDTVIKKLDSQLNHVRGSKEKSVNCKLFLMLQEVVTETANATGDIRGSLNSLNHSSLSFMPDQVIRDFLSSSYTLGSLSKDRTPAFTDIWVPDIVFPIAHFQQAPPISTQSQQHQSGLFWKTNYFESEEPKRSVTGSQTTVSVQQTETTRVEKTPKQKRFVTGFQATGIASVPGLPFNVISANQSAQKQWHQPKASSTSDIKAIKCKIPLSKIKARKRSSYYVHTKDDGKNSNNITGIAISGDGRKLLVDKFNSKVKLLSPDMQHVSSLSLTVEPRDVVMIGDQSAVVTTEKSLIILDITDGLMSIKSTSHLTNYIRHASKYKDNFIFTCPKTVPPTVKMIDNTGRLCWSASTDHQGQLLFSQPRYVTSHADGRSTAVVVSDDKDRSLTLLNGESGEVVTTLHLAEKIPKGLTMDHAGNVYVCYCGTDEVSVMSPDLAEEVVLLSKRDGLCDKPKVIAYDGTSHQLIIAYQRIFGVNTVDLFQLS